MILVSIYNSKTSKSSSVDVIQSLKEYKIIIFKLFSDHLSRNKFFFIVFLLHASKISCGTPSPFIAHTDYIIMNDLHVK